ncbi:hypothetical protein LB543_32060 [Mesorhizobium sp. ESP7-2]|uniref:hypothetical protein n=1 Tax=unclassified Mesorhizobium TaxID=325217 RepID=UPI001CCF6DFD|nr:MULTISPECIES: hypothetical protein [unclassified Mesorhizobium]MBZ9673951.1 hypothetical protein [Mesorhizobium sp. ES1-3]MBZ9711335.1 hypothetical protein [Mesorhizobium sp. ESP7-2]
MIQRHGLNISHGVCLEMRHLAGKQAGKTALLAGSIDGIILDWLCGTRPPGEGAGLVFVAYSRAVGALAPAALPVRRLADFNGKRLANSGQVSPLVDRIVDLEGSPADLVRDARIARDDESASLCGPAGAQAGGAG